MAWRESRSGRRRLWLLTGAVTAGVAALVAINSFTQNLRTSVAEQARTLLGADLSITGRQPLSPRVNALIDSLIAPGAAPGGRAGRRALEVSFAAMAYVPRTSGVRLVQVRAIEGGYPFYGEVTTDPAGYWRSLATGRSAMVDPALLTALGARVGDTLALGNARYAISATVLSVPGDVRAVTAFGPRVYIAAATLPETGLLQFGSRAEYAAFVELPPGVAAQPIRETYRQPLRVERVSIRTVEDDRDRLTDSLTRLGNYLGLVALIALLLGGLGVASAVHVFIKRKLDTIAVLRCLGATATEVFAIYLLQALVMGGLGSAFGALLGVGLQQALPALFRDLLPVDVRVLPSPRAILLGMGLGLWVAGIFAVLPLLTVRRVSPLMTLRRDVEPAGRGRDGLTWVVAVLLGASVIGLAAVQVGRLRDGIIFAAGTGAALLVLWLAARGLMHAVRRWFPRRWPYLWRQGLANLYRPANQTVTVVLALGFGAFLLATLFLVQHNLLREFRPGGMAARPNLMFFDIQPAQREGVQQLLQARGFHGTPLVPIVTMRLKTVKGSPVQPGGPAGWAARREYRSSYRDTLTATEKVVAGAWWRPGIAAPPPGVPAQVSLEAGIAQELGVTLGDTIGWDVQGAEVPTTITSLREVDWGRFETNFFVVFQPGVLEAAPQMFVTLVRADSADARGGLQRAMAERYPNVTALDLSQLQQALDGILDKGALIVRFLALFSLVTGTIVLIGAVSASRLQRVREAVLLKTLGATRRQVLRILVAEYIALGLLAALTSVVLAAAAAWALARWVFDSPFNLPAMELGGLTLLLVGLTLTVGLWNSAEILGRAPLAVLREE